MGDVEKRLKTEILVEKYPEERLRALAGELTWPGRKMYLPQRQETSEQSRKR